MLVRDIDTAGGLYDRARVLRALMRAMLWSIPLYFLGAFGGALLLPGENLPISEWPERLAVPLAISIGAMALIAVAIWAKGLGVRIAALASALVLVFSIGYSIFLLDISRQIGPLWTGTTAFRTIVVAWIAAEAVPGVWSLLFGRSPDLAVAREPRNWSTFFGAPAAIATLSLGKRRTALLFVFASFLFAFGSMQFSNLLVSARASLDNAFRVCGALAPELRTACFDRIAIGDAWGLFFVWPAVFVLSFLAARRVRKAARRRTLASAADAMKHDERPPILFLRWFGNDQGEMAEARQTPLRWLLASSDGEPTIDRMLVEEYSRLGPTVALGQNRKPGDTMEGDDRKKRFGVWRDFPPDEEWQDHLRRMAERARAIVIMIDVTERAGKLDVTDGVKFELDLLSRPDMRQKSLFLVGSQSLAPEGLARVWALVGTHTKLDVGAVALDGHRPLGAFLGVGDTVSVATSRRFTRSDYAMTLRWFFDNIQARPVIPANVATV